MVQNILDGYKLLQDKKPLDVDKNLAYPLLRYASGNSKNLSACQKINKMFFKIPSRMVISLLHANCTFPPFLRYPKPSKKLELDASDKLIKERLCQIYKWSSNEYDKNFELLSSLDRQVIAKFINQKVGLDKKESKTLGVDYNVKKYKFEPTKPKPVGLNSYM
jgi:hypothetical protein